MLAFFGQFSARTPTKDSGKHEMCIWPTKKQQCSGSHMQYLAVANMPEQESNTSLLALVTFLITSSTCTTLFCPCCNTIFPWNRAVSPNIILLYRECKDIVHLVLPLWIESQHFPMHFGAQLIKNSFSTGPWPSKIDGPHGDIACYMVWRADVRLYIQQIAHNTVEYTALKKQPNSLLERESFDPDPDSPKRWTPETSISSTLYLLSSFL